MSQLSGLTKGARTKDILAMTDGSENKGNPDAGREKGMDPGKTAPPAN